MEGWEYEVILLKEPPDEETLDEEGELGWELVSVVPSGAEDYYYAFFKKRIESGAENRKTEKRSNRYDYGDASVEDMIIE